MPRKRTKKTEKAVEKTQTVEEEAPKSPETESQEVPKEPQDSEVKSQVLEAFKKCQEPQFNLNKLAELLKKFYEEVSKLLYYIFLAQFLNIKYANLINNK